MIVSKAPKTVSKIYRQRYGHIDWAKTISNPSKKKPKGKKK